MSETDTTFVFSAQERTWLPATSHPIPNRGLNFGDGVFETMVFDGKGFRFLDFHTDRAKGGLEALEIEKVELDALGLERFLLSNFPGKKLRVRLNLFRSGQGKYTPLENHLVQLAFIEPFQPSSYLKNAAGFSDFVRLYHSSMSRFKTLNSIPYVLAALERQRKHWDEIILLDSNGKISEAGASNIFWQKENWIFTPSLSCGCIAGVSRRVILKEINRLDLRIAEGSFDPEEILDAEKVWVSNVTGISYLASINSSKFSTEPLEWLDKIFE